MAKLYSLDRNIPPKFPFIPIHCKLLLDENAYNDFLNGGGLLFFPPSLFRVMTFAWIDEENRIDDCFFCRWCFCFVGLISSFDVLLLPVLDHVFPGACPIGTLPICRRTLQK